MPGRNIKKIPRLSGLLAALIAALGIFGQWIGAPALYAYFPNRVGMVNMTSYGILLCSSALFCLHFSLVTHNLMEKKQWEKRATLIFSLVFWFFTFLLVNYYYELGLFNGPSSPRTAIGFMLISLCHLFRHVQLSIGHYLGQLLGVLALVLSFAAATGHIFGAPRLYKFYSLIGMAFPTALALFLIALGAMSAQVDRGIVKALVRPGVTGSYLRFFIVASLLVPVILAALFEIGTNFQFYNLREGTTLFVTTLTVLFVSMSWSASNRIFILEEQNRNKVRMKASYEAFAQSRENLNALFHDAPVLISINEGPEHIFTFSNKMHDEAIGFRKVIGKGLREVFPELEGQQIFEQFDRAYQNGETTKELSMRVLLPHQREDASEAFFDVVRQPFKNALGEIIGVSSFAFDVTDQVRAHELVLEKQREQELLINALPGLIAYVDKELRYVFVNETYKKWFGKSREEIVGKSIQEVIGEGPYKKSLPIYKKVLRGEYEQSELEITNHDNKRFYVQTQFVPKKNGDGKTEGFYVLGTDITLLREAQKDMENTLAMREEFMSIASHELKTPLTVLVAQSEFAAMILNSEDEVVNLKDQFQEFVKNTDVQLQRVQHLVDDMMEFIKASSGDFTVHFEPCDALGIVRDLIEESPKEPITITKAPSSLPVQGDCNKIKQALSNLISNAIKYGQDGPIEIDIKKEDDSAIIKIKDFGRGIAKEDQARIFEKFERAVYAKDVSGLGIGLFISRKIARLHGGELEVESALGKGSTFTLKLPLAQDSITRPIKS